MDSDETEIDAVIVAITLILIGRLRRLKDAQLGIRHRYQPTIEYLQFNWQPTA